MDQQEMTYTMVCRQRTGSPASETQAWRPRKPGGSSPLVQHLSHAPRPRPVEKRWSPCRTPRRACTHAPAHLHVWVLHAQDVNKGDGRLGQQRLDLTHAVGSGQQALAHGLQLVVRNHLQGSRRHARPPASARKAGSAAGRHLAEKRGWAALVACAADWRAPGSAQGRPSLAAGQLTSSSATAKNTTTLTMLKHVWTRWGSSKQSAGARQQGAESAAACPCHVVACCADGCSGMASPRRVWPVRAAGSWVHVCRVLLRPQQEAAAPTAGAAARCWRAPHFAQGR
jgi:hypothetical protein